jgi:hypothetical protein
MDAAAYDQAAPGLLDTLKKQPGFIMHVAYPIPGGFVVGEIWETQEQQEQWMTEFVRPNVPAEVNATAEVFQVHNLVQR